MPGAIPPTGRGYVGSVRGPSPQDPQQLAADIAQAAVQLAGTQDKATIQALVARMERDLAALSNMKSQLPPNAQATLQTLIGTVNNIAKDAPSHIDPQDIAGAAYVAGVLAGELER